MTLTDELDATPSAVSDPSTVVSVSPPLVAGLSAVVIGILAGALYLQGTFYPVDAFGMSVLALGLIAAGVSWNRDRHGRSVAMALGGLAGWWFARAVAEHTPGAFFPFGASILAFLAAYLVLRALVDQDRTRVVSALVAVGALLAGAGVVGVLGRWLSLAQHMGGTWRASTTLTYPAATAVVCVSTVLLSLACDLRSPLVRLAAGTGVAGLLATQSHWELVALAAGALIVPRHRWTDAVWPLFCGAVAGMTVAASSSSAKPGIVAWVVTLGALAASLAPVRLPNTRWVRTAAGVAVIVLAAGMIVAVLQTPTTGSHQSAGQSQTLAWSASVDTWRSSPVTGNGPPRIHTTSGAVGTYPGLVPDTYLASGAGGGAVAVVLLLLSGAVVAASIRRRDRLTSCATAATVAFAVAGCVNFAWQLPALALLGGCVAGLAAVPVARRVPRPGAAGAGDSAVVPADVAAIVSTGSVAPHHGTRAQILAAGVWTLVVVTVVATQGLVGNSRAAGGVTHAVVTEPPHLIDTSAPGRQILTGPDPTDPLMLNVDGRYFVYTSEGTSTLNVPLRTGPRPGRWGAATDVLPVLPPWAQGGRTWAPDVHRVAGGWALYFTALVKDIDPSTHCIGAAYARSPSGPFVATKAPFICQLDHRGTIDARVIDTPGGNLVIVFKSEDNANPSVPGPDQNGLSGIYAQHLSADGRTLLGKPTKILGPTQAWEGTIVEAPDMIQAWGTWWLFFSGNWYLSPTYGIGVAACQGPFGPCADPSPAPFLGSNLQGPGPGEASLFDDAGTVSLLYNPFHANDPGPVIPRPVVMARLGFTAQGPYLAKR
jgi:hypothetical protein